MLLDQTSYLTNNLIAGDLRRRGARDDIAQSVSVNTG